MSLQFEVDNDSLAVVKNTVINANFDETKKNLLELIEPYKTMVVIKDGISEAKSDRARIRKVASSIDECRKMVKKVYTEPLAIFENKCKELTSICKEGADNLDVQIKEYEEIEKNEKIHNLEYFFDEQEKKHGEYITFADVYDERWRNSTFDIETAKDIIREAIKKTDTEVDIILELQSDFELSLLMDYKATHDIVAVLKKKSELDSAKAQEIEKAKQSDRKTKVDLDDVPEEFARELKGQESTDWYSEINNAVARDMTEIYSATFTVKATAQELNAIRLFLEKNKIWYTEE